MCDNCDSCIASYICISSEIRRCIF